MVAGIVVSQTAKWVRIREKNGLPPRQNHQKTKAQKTKSNNRGGGGNNSDKINKVCSFYRRDACTKGDKCKWLHPQGEQGKSRKVSLGNGQFEREVGRAFVKHTFAANLGPPVERGAAKRQLDSGSSDEELVFGEDGEEPVSRKKKSKLSDKEAARKFLAKWQQTQCWTIVTDQGLQGELLSGKHGREIVTGVDVAQCVQDLVGSVEQQVSEIAPVPGLSRAGSSAVCAGLGWFG